MRKIRALVVDDEKPSRARLSKLLKREDDIEVVGAAANGRDAVEMIRELSPDLIYLDVHMPLLDGFGVVREITPARMPCTVFVTAYDEFALQAFENHALDYLLKPYSDERFRSALEHVRRYLQANDQTSLRPKLSDLLAAAKPGGEDWLERLVLKSSGRVLFLPVDDIDWIEAAGVYVRFHTGSKGHLYRSSIAQLLTKLNPKQFVRIHRSTIVNTSRIKELHTRGHGDYTLLLKDGTELVLSRVFRGAVEEWLRQQL